MVRRRGMGDEGDQGGRHLRRTGLWFRSVTCGQSRTCQLPGGRGRAFDRSTAVEELRHGSRRHGRWRAISQLAELWLSVILQVQPWEGLE
jgi:hypothetical protein